MTYIKVIGTPLYQWESGRKIQIIPLPNMHINAVHFSNFGDAEALVVTPREENGNIIADIPNILLQSGANLVVYTVNVAADCVETLVECTISVRNRAKPADYVYTETEVLTITTAVEKALQEAKDSGEFNGKDGKDGKDADYSLVANALKGKASGSTIALNDVSPFEHEMSVNVDRNILDVSKLLKETSWKEENGYYTGTSHELYIKYGLETDGFMSLDGVETATLSFYGYYGRTQDDGANGMSAHFVYTDGTNDAVKINSKTERYYTLTSNPNKKLKKLCFSYGSDSGKHYLRDIRLDVGGVLTVTKYEENKEPITYTADENGTVNGIIGNGENMTLVANSGIITAEYNKDINKVIESLVNAIISLGGNV